MPSTGLAADKARADFRAILEEKGHTVEITHRAVDRPMGDLDGVALLLEDRPEVGPGLVRGETRRRHRSALPDR